MARLTPVGCDRWRTNPSVARYPPLLLPSLLRPPAWPSRPRQVDDPRLRGFPCKVAMREKVRRVNFSDEERIMLGQLAKVSAFGMPHARAKGREGDAVHAARERSILPLFPPAQTPLAPPTRSRASPSRIRSPLAAELKAPLSPSPPRCTTAVSGTPSPTR
jgi:hypothetical protein